MSEVIFDESYIPEPNSGCWIWLRGDNGAGYGTFKPEGKSVLAHRFSYERHYGQIPAGAHILHRCDVRCCVNPNHLFIGDWSDNQIDSVRKGRAGNQKLSLEDALAIRLDKRTRREIAVHYGVSPSLVKRVKTRKSWWYV